MKQGQVVGLCPGCWAVAPGGAGAWISTTCWLNCSQMGPGLWTCQPRR